MRRMLDICGAGGAAAVGLRREKRRRPSLGGAGRLRGCLDGHRGLFGALFRPGRGGLRYDEALEAVQGYLDGGPRAG